MMAPGIPQLAYKYGITNETIIAMTLCIYLLSFAIGVCCFLQLFAFNMLIFLHNSR